MQGRIEASLGDATRYSHTLRSDTCPSYKSIKEPEVTSNSRVLVLAPHLEDPIIGCGGTICKLAKRGAHIKVLFMTDSSYGSDINHSSKLVPMVKKDAEDSLAMLRCYESENLNLPCLAMRCDISSKGRLHYALDHYSPDIVFIPSLQDMHPDNIMTGLLAASTLMEYDSCLTPYSYDVWGGLSPNNLVDITEVMDDKIAALKACSSRAVDNGEHMKNENTFRLSSIYEDRNYEPFLRQKREDFVIRAWQLRVPGYIDRT
jgi:LmbE family N-acetylglucosaminyl deacetylase